MRLVLPRSGRRAAVAACLGVLVALLPTTAFAGPGRKLVHRTNRAREHHGLREYRDRALLTDMAQKWAAWMADHRTLEHNPNLEQQAGSWCWLGENVGKGGSARRVQREFMHSPEHRANILSTHFTQVGIGTAWSGAGVLYVDEVFRRPC